MNPRPEGLEPLHGLLSVSPSAGTQSRPQRDASVSHLHDDAVYALAYLPRQGFRRRDSDILSRRELQSHDPEVSGEGIDNLRMVLLDKPACANRLEGGIVDIDSEPMATALSPHSIHKMRSSIVASTEPAASPLQAKTILEQQPSTTKTLPNK